MKLIDDLKEKVENAKTKEEARDTIKEAGMLLDDEELDKASGGGEVISMNCVFEAYEPHEFRMIKEMFELRVEENA